MSDKINDNPRYEKDEFGSYRVITLTSAMSEACHRRIELRLHTGRKRPASDNRLRMDLQGERRTELSGFLYGVNLEVDNRETLT